MQHCGKPQTYCSVGVDCKSQMILSSMHSDHPTSAQWLQLQLQLLLVSKSRTTCIMTSCATSRACCGPPSSSYTRHHVTFGSMCHARFGDHCSAILLTTVLMWDQLFGGEVLKLFLCQEL